MRAVLFATIALAALASHADNATKRIGVRDILPEYGTSFYHDLVAR